MKLTVFAPLICLMFLTACSGARYEADAEAKYPPIGQFVTVEGLDVHYIDQGSGPTVILIHGANSNIRDWTFAMVDELSAKHRVIAMDRPGHGYSDRPAEGGDIPAVQARILKLAADQLVAGDAVIVGHSFGGAVASAWALDYPEGVKGLISLAGATYDWGGGGGTLYALGSSEVTGGALGAAARAYVSGDRAISLINDVFAPNEPIPGYAEHLGLPLALRPATFRYNAADIDNLDGHLAVQSQRYGELTMPVILIHGDADQTVGLQEHSVRFFNDVSSSDLVVMPGIGHMIHQVARPTIIAAVEKLAGTAD